MGEKMNSVGGFPIGNSIALVGDPGTGKTTFLLSFFRYAKAESGRVSVSPKSIGNRFSNLFRFNNEITSVSQPSLRVFVSLESSFSRMFSNNKELLSCSGNKNDIYIFIDATSFLSGRLQDRLRYPNLAKEANKEAEFWRDSEFNLGGFSPDESQEFGLYWQPEGEMEPLRIEQLGSDCPFNGLDNHPFCSNAPCRLAEGSFDLSNTKKCKTPRESENPDYRFYNLMTPSLGDPISRVIILKDLFAEIFSNFPGHTTRFLAIDSLSALLSRFDGQESSDLTIKARRLPMLNLIRWLEEHDVTTMMSCEADKSSDNTVGGQALFLGSDERYLSSGVIQLDYHRYRSGDMIRYFRILKMRGCQHDMRPHAYDIDEKGISWIEPLFGEPQGDD